MEATSSSSFTWSKTRVLSTFCLGLAVFLVFFSWLASSKANTSALSATTTSASSLYSWFLPVLDHSTARSSLSQSESGFQEPKHLAGRSSSGSVDNNSSNLEKPTKDGNFTQSWENNATRSSVEGLPHHGRPSWKPPDVSRQGLRQTKRRNGSAEEMRGVSSAKCDLFDGRWVRWDGNGKPYYPAGSCPHIDVDFNCHQNGRPDDGFVTWKWQPYGCNLPSLNATDFLERLRGKRLIFVGDSLNRNMWESLVCILRHSITNKSHVYEISGRREFKTSGYYAFRFEDNNCSVDFVRSPFLVREAYQKNATGSEDEKLRLDQLDETTAAYSEADVIVFNTGHWWTHEKTSRGIYYYQEGDHVHPYLKAMEAFKKALTTWARWIDEHINPNRTQVVFRGYSLTHFRGGQWNSGGQCHKETEPIFKETYIAKYPSKMRVLEQVLHQMKTPVIYLNISRLTGYRKDAHPAIYRKEYKTVEEQLAAESSGQDCSHWCLPGVPDTWNELLYASLLMHGRGSWKKR